MDWFSKVCRIWSIVQQSLISVLGSHRSWIILSECKLSNVSSFKTQLIEAFGKCLKRKTLRESTSTLASKAKAEAAFQAKFPSQSGRLGLGFGKFNTNPSRVDLRKRVTEAVFKFAEEKRLQHSHQLSQSVARVGRRNNSF